MRKKCIVAIVILSLYVVGCEPSVYNFDKDYYGNKIERIELRYSIIKQKPIIIFLKNGKSPQFQIEDSLLLETIEESKISDFINDFSKIDFFEFANCCNEPFGFIVVIYLLNNNYIISSCSSYGKEYYGIFAEFNENNEFVQSFGQIAEVYKYEVVIKKYFDSFVGNTL